MSAFIVNDYHVNALVSYGVANRAQYWSDKNRQWVYFNDETAPALASRIYRANVCSVNRRYGERTRAAGFKFQPVSIGHLSAADIIRACDCLDYQSCETDSWDRSEAKKTLWAIREKAIQALATCSRAWHLDEPALETA